MAYSIRIHGLGRDGTELLQMEPHWWEISKLSENVQFKWIESNDTGSYSDDDADISIDEARILHEQFRPELLATIAYNLECVESSKMRTDEHAASVLKQYLDYVERLQSALNALDFAVGEGAGDFSHFHICVFEWDSGF
jgi:hypothetical protein